MNKQERIEAWTNAMMGHVRSDPDRFIPDPDERRQFLVMCEEADLFFGSGWQVKRRLESR